MCYGSESVRSVRDEAKVKAEQVKQAKADVAYYEARLAKVQKVLQTLSK